MERVSITGGTNSADATDLPIRAPAPRMAIAAERLALPALRAAAPALDEVVLLRVQAAAGQAVREVVVPVRHVIAM